MAADKKKPDAKEEPPKQADDIGQSMSADDWDAFEEAVNERAEEASKDKKQEPTSFH